MQLKTLLLAAALLATGTNTNADTLVVCSPVFEQALKPWITYRTGQGHVIQVVSNAGNDNDIRAKIRGAAKSGKLKSVVLIGDATSTTADPLITNSVNRPPVPQPAEAHLVPTHLLPTTVSRAWGSPPEMATDNWYADLDDDSAPDVAIGRLTADSPQELTGIINKIIAYEQNADFGPWRNRVNFVAGAGGFGMLADRFLERLARSVITLNVPTQYAATMTYACWQSPFCPDPRKLNTTVVDRMNEGCLFWVYLGHGSPSALKGTAVSPDFRWNDIFKMSDLTKLKSSGAPSIAVFLACDTGAYDLARDCLAEELLRNPDGPVAVFSGSRYTMPYGMTVLGLGLMQGVFVDRHATVGEVFLHAKRNLVLGSWPQPARATLLAISRGFAALPQGLPVWAWKTWPLQIARKIGTVPADFAQERIEHASLFNLFGDPLLRLHYPKDIQLDVARTVIAGQPLDITIHSPIEGECRVELLLPRDRQPLSLPERARFNGADRALSAYSAVYNQANDARVAGVTIQTTRPRATPGDPAATGAQATARLIVPANLAGRCHVRAVIAGKQAFALGAANIEVQSAAR